MRKKILSAIALILLSLVITISYKAIEILQSVQCEKEAFSDPEFRGGDEFGELFKKCMKEKNIIELLMHEKQ